MSHQRAATSSVSIGFFVFLSATVCAQTQIWTANYGNQRTNTHTAESQLNRTNVSMDTFGKLGSFPVDGNIYAQPLAISGVNIGGSIYNAIFIATMHNSVYAIDADQPTRTVPLWQVNFGASVSAEFLDCDDVWPEVGILSTPVVDLQSKTLYVVSDSFEEGAAVFRLHALNLADGSEKAGSPVVITASAKGDGDGSDGTNIAFDPNQPETERLRPGMSVEPKVRVR